jgi:hypothetical protein
MTGAISTTVSLAGLIGFSRTFFPIALLLTRDHKVSNLYIRTLYQRSITQRCSQLGPNQDGIHHPSFAPKETGKPRKPSAPTDLPGLRGVPYLAPGLLALSPLLLSHL